MKHILSKERVFLPLLYTITSGYGSHLNEKIGCRRFLQVTEASESGLWFRHKGQHDGSLTLCSICDHHKGDTEERGAPSSKNCRPHYSPLMSCTFFFLLRVYKTCIGNTQPM